MTVRELITYLELAEPYREVKVHAGDRCYGVGSFRMDPAETEVVMYLSSEERT